MNNTTQNFQATPEAIQQLRENQIGNQGGQPPIGCQWPIEQEVPIVPEDPTVVAGNCSTTNSSRPLYIEEVHKEWC